MHHLQNLKNNLSAHTDTFEIALQGEKSFTVTPVIQNNIVLGVNVSNLDTNRFLPIEVFAVTISLLSWTGDKQAPKGNAHVKLGEVGLPLNSVEGHVARIVYGKTAGDSVFRRIVPISRILEWADVCHNGRGYLQLK
jgi:hypothetical protein